MTIRPLMIGQCEPKVDPMVDRYRIDIRSIIHAIRVAMLCLRIVPSSIREDFNHQLAVEIDTSRR